MDALNASGAQTDYAPLPLLYANLMAETAIAYLGLGYSSTYCGPQAHPAGLSQGTETKRPALGGRAFRTSRVGERSEYQTDGSP